MRERSPIRWPLVLLALTAVCAMAGACTIGVAAGRATDDGRPLLWKVRDNGAVPDNEVHHNTSLLIPYTAVVTADGAADSPAWMGANRHGFAIVNANALDLEQPAQRANGEFMRLALGSCRSVAEFTALLEATAGIRDTHGSFGVIDSTGAALMIEASRDSSWTFDTRDTDRGVIVRTNFACVDTAGSDGSDLAGWERFVRSRDLIDGWVDHGELTVANLAGQHARDFSDWASRPVEVPCFACGEPDSLYGVFDTFFSISSGGTVSAAVIQGVLAPPADEPAWLTTMWVHLGQPACTIASPYWPVGPTPAVSDGSGTAPLCDLANRIREDLVFDVPWYPRLVDTFALRDGEGGGLWSVLRPAERTAIMAVEARLAAWRADPPEVGAVLAYQDSLATAAHDLLALDVVTPVSPRPPAPRGSAAALRAHPNPFNPATTLTFTLARAGHARLVVHDAAGRAVATLLDDAVRAGRHTVTWRADDTTGRRLPTGLYLAHLTVEGQVSTRKILLVK
ncbi:T9SS type A sorting domain-containing protein [bacterium]|nr:T9SS type A sorting domain-containing protein [bacterium]